MAPVHTVTLLPLPISILLSLCVCYLYTTILDLYGHLSKMMLCDVHGLLGRPGALDRRVWQREDRVPTLEVHDGGVRLLHVVGVIVGTHSRGFKGLGQAFDL